jgi:hypothetical protein
VSDRAFKFGRGVRRAIGPGPRAQRMSKFHLGDEIIFLKGTYSVNYFKLDCKSKELLQELLELGVSGVFPHITIVLLIFVTLPHQWLQMNTLLLC